MSYELSGPPAFRRVGGVRRPLHLRRHYQIDQRRISPRQLEGLGFSLRPSKKVRKFAKRYGKRIAIGAALAIAAPFVLPAIAAGGAALWSSGAAGATALFHAGQGLFKKKPAGLPTPPADWGSTSSGPYAQRDTQPDQGSPGVDSPVPMSAPGFPGGGAGGGLPGGGVPEQSQDDTTPPTPTAAGGAGLAVGALLVGGLLLASRSSKRS